MVCWRQPSFLLSQKTVSHSPSGETPLCVSTQQFHLQDCAILYVLSSWLICAKNKIELFCPRKIARSGKLRWRALTVSTYISPLQIVSLLWLAGVKHSYSNSMMPLTPSYFPRANTTPLPFPTSPSSSKREKHEM